MNEPAARGLDEITRAVLNAGYAAVKLTYESESWKHLGFDSFAEWAAEQPKYQLSRDDRRTLALEYRDAGMTQRDIGAALGVDVATVNRDLNPVADATEITPFPAPATNGAVADATGEADMPAVDADILLAHVTGLSDLRMNLKPDAIAAGLHVANRSAFAKRLRRIGRYLDSIATELEEQS
jgi:hypothetical protein